MSKTFFATLLTAFIPISALNHIAERDTTAVTNAERKQLSSSFDDSHTIELVPQPPNHSLHNPHQAVHIILHNRQNTGLSMSYHFTGKAITPLQTINPQHDGAAFYTSPQSLQKIYESSCRMIADYRPSLPLFGTNHHTIRTVRETDITMHRALTACPRRYQDIRINRP